MIFIPTCKSCTLELSLADQITLHYHRSDH